MEKYYFIEKDGVKLGPFKLDDLKNHTIYSDELVWRSDSENWKKAIEFEELNGVCILKPPPTPHEQVTTQATQNNTLTKKPFVISERLTVSIPIGFAVSFLIVVLAHISPSDWEAMPITNGKRYFTFADKVSGCSYKCILGERHGANCSGLSFSQVDDKSLTIDEVLSASLEHLWTIGIVGLILATIIFFIDGNYSSCQRVRAIKGHEPPTKVYVPLWGFNVNL